MKQMFQKGAPAIDFDMIIGQSSSMEGDIKSGGSVRIDGHINGDIQAEGDVIIGPEADVHGNISASNIELSGAVEGNIHSGGLLKIHASGVLRGDIEVMSFVIDEGGAFEGLCNINTSSLPARRDSKDSKNNHRSQSSNPSKDNNNQSKTGDSSKSTPSNNTNTNQNKGKNNNQKSA